MTDMGLEYNYGLMVLNMKDNGTITKLKAKAHSGMLKVMFMRENLRMIKLTAMVFIPM